MPHSIVIADDEVHILRAAEFKFRRAGFDVRCANDGEEAWSLIQESLPELLITDYQMPRLDGMELIERLRANKVTMNLPVIMLTAKGFEIAREEVQKKLNVSAIFSKPFSPREILRCATELLEKGVCEVPAY